MLLIVGGDARLSRFITLLYPQHVVTTRRTDSLSDKLLYLDLKETIDFKIPCETKYCVIVGGPITYRDGEDDFTASLDVHAYQIPLLVEKLLIKNIHVTYISSNMVFGNSEHQRSENSLTSPEINYGKLKVICEETIIKTAKKYSKSELLCIIRLTKNISKDTGPFDKWAEAYKNNLTIKAFDDLYFSPINFEASAKFIVKAIKSKMHGILHYSNEVDINYYEFSVRLNQHLASKGMKRLSVIRSSSEKEGIKLVFKGCRTRLSMDRTFELLNEKPLKIEDICSYFCSNLFSQ